MAELVSILLSFPPEKQLQPEEYGRAATQYVKQIADITPSEWGKGTKKTNVFEVVDPAVNSIAYLYALTNEITKLNGDLQTAQPLLPQITKFFTVFDAVQTRYAAVRWQALYNWTAEALVSLQQRDVAFMAQGLQRLENDQTSFTVCHLSFVRMCIRAQVPSLARLILDHDIYSLPRTNKTPSTMAGDVVAIPGSLSDDQSTIVHAETVLEYYLLGAQIYIGLSNWTRAKLFLDFVILHPSANHAASIFQVEAYKKWVLISLLTNGGPSPVQRTTDQAVLKLVRAAARPYDTLADTFKSRNWRKVIAEIDVGSQIWQDDGNTRLVQAVADSILLYCVTDLQKTYVSVPVSTIARHLRLSNEESLDLVQRLIQQRRLKARIIDHDSGDALRFDDNLDTAGMTFAHETAAQTARINGLVQAIADADRRLRLTREYLDVSRRNKRQTAENDPADQMDLEWHAPAEPANDIADDGDEDIMA